MFDIDELVIIKFALKEFHNSPTCHVTIRKQIVKILKKIYKMEG